MRTARILLMVGALAGAVALAAVRLGPLLRSLRSSAAAGLTSAPPAGSAGTEHIAGRRRTSPRWRRGREVGRGRIAGPHPDPAPPLRPIAVETAAGLALVGALAGGLVARRAIGRRRRVYALYELHLSTHDEAKGQDLEDLIETIADIVRVGPAERARDGQPYVALELICGIAFASDQRLEMEWSINIRCEPRTAAALDGALTAAYPDVRLGHRHGGAPRPRPGSLRAPGHVVRYRKQRPFMYSLIAAGERPASSPLEQIARAQVAAGEPSLVRFQLTPTPVAGEALARFMHRRHERRLGRTRAGSGSHPLWSSFDRAELLGAQRTQNRSLFWLEAVIGADTRQACESVGAAVQARRGENRLQGRRMIVRRRLYRRRFARALGPMLPAPRSLVSAAEVAHLLELPSARMKGVPVRRVPVPRIPAPPEVARGCRPRVTPDRQPIPVSPTSHGGGPSR